MFPSRSLRSAFASGSRLPSLVAVVGLACAASLGCTMRTGSGVLESETREVDELANIEVCCGFAVDVSYGKTASAKVTTDQELLADVVLETEGETLVIGWKDSATSYQPSHGVKVALTLPELSSVVASGGSEVTAEGIGGAASKVVLSGGSTLSLPQGELNADSLTATLSGASHMAIMAAALTTLELELSGGSNCLFGTVNSTSARVVASGGSHLEAAGIGDDVNLNASGDSELELSELAARRVAVEASGGSHVAVDAREELSIEASGGSQVTYRKEPPEFQATLSGGSTAAPAK
jgi:hypothetical protein